MDCIQQDLARPAIRAMSIADYQPVVKLWRRAEGVGLNQSDTRPAIARYLRRNRGMSAVAVQHGRIIGAVLCGHDGRRGYLHHLAVNQHHRRQGIAKALLRFCFQRLAKQRIPKCNIFLFADNPSGQAFWLHNRWRRRDDLRVLQRPVTRNRV